MTASQTRVAAPTEARATAGAYLHLAIVYVVWGCTYFAVKLTLSGPAPIAALSMQALRMWFGAALLGALTWLSVGAPRGLARGDLLRCGATGVLMWATGNGLATYCAPYAASSFIVMALGTIPLWSVAIECAVRRALPDRRLLAALVLGLAGLALVLAPALAATRGHVVQPGHALAVVLLLVAAGATWGLGTVLQRPLAARLAPGWIATLQMVAAAAVLTLLAGAGHARLPLSGYGLVQLAAFAFLVVFGSVISQSSYVIVTRSFSAAVAATFAYVNPLIGMLLGWLFLHEVIAPLALAGFAVVLASITLVLRQRHR